jgi:hypothetical protein
VSTNTSGQQELSSTGHMPNTVDGNALWLAAPSGNGVFGNAPGAADSGTVWINPGSVDKPSLVTGGKNNVTSSVNSSTTHTITRGQWRALHADLGDQHRRRVVQHHRQSGGGRQLCHNAVAAHAVPD